MHLITLKMSILKSKNSQIHIFKSNLSTLPLILMNYLVMNLISSRIWLTKLSKKNKNKHTNTIQQQLLHSINNILVEDIMNIMKQANLINSNHHILKLKNKAELQMNFHR